MAFQFVQQQANNDCGIACICMATGLGLKETTLCFPVLQHNDGIGVEDIYIFLSEHGVNCKLSKTLKPLQKAIVLVKSISTPNGQHFVYYDGKLLHDPNKGRPNIKYFTNLSECKIKAVLLVK